MQERIENLEAGIRVLEERLLSEVVAHQEELLEQAKSLRDAEGAVRVRALYALKAISTITLYMPILDRASF